MLVQAVNRQLYRVGGILSVYVVLGTLIFLTYFRGVKSLFVRSLYSQRIPLLEVNGLLLILGIPDSLLSGCRIGNGLHGHIGRIRRFIGFSLLILISCLALYTGDYIGGRIVEFDEPCRLLFLAQCRGLQVFRGIITLLLGGGDVVLHLLLDALLLFRKPFGGILILHFRGALVPLDEDSVHLFAHIVGGFHLRGVLRPAATAATTAATAATERRRLGDAILLRSVPRDISQLLIPLFNAVYRFRGGIITGLESSLRQRGGLFLCYLDYPCGHTPIAITCALGRYAPLLFGDLYAVAIQLTNIHILAAMVVAVFKRGQLLQLLQLHLRQTDIFRIGRHSSRPALDSILYLRRIVAYQPLG